MTFVTLHQLETVLDSVLDSNSSQAIGDLIARRVITAVFTSIRNCDFEKSVSCICLLRVMSRRKVVMSGNVLKRTINNRWINK